MRLFEAVVDANHRALAGETTAGLHPADYADALPVAALTCIDSRLNALLPSVLGIADEDFIWLRNAGNIITSSLSSTMRSLALACAIKGAKEIAVVGHTDCRVRQTTILDLTSRFQALGVDRARLPENLTEFFGLFASERQNVIQAVERIRTSPIIGVKIPVHGLLVDVQSGRLEWLVNGYQALDVASSMAPRAATPRLRETAERTLLAANELVQAAAQAATIRIGDVTSQALISANEVAKAATAKIGDVTSQAMKWLADVKIPPLPGSEPETTLQIGRSAGTELGPTARFGERVPTKNPAPIRISSIPVPPRLPPSAPPPKGRK